jgi:hypothetical protein
VAFFPLPHGFCTGLCLLGLWEGGGLAHNLNVLAQTFGENFSKPKKKS